MEAKHFLLEKEIKLVIELQILQTKGQEKEDESEKEKKWEGEKK